VKKNPKDFPDPVNRKKRKLEVLEIAPLQPPKPPTKEEIKALKKRDHQVLNLLKIQIQPIVDQIHRKYKKFRNPVIPTSSFQYLLDEVDPNFVRPDIPPVTFRPYEFGYKDGVKGLVETASGKFFYNMQTNLIEERLSNGFYARPKDFLADIRKLAKDAKNSQDKERTLRAKELVANVEVDMAMIEAQPAFADCENIYQRQLERAKEAEAKAKKAEVSDMMSLVRSDIDDSILTSPSARPPILGPINTRGQPTPFYTPSNLSNGYTAESEHRNGTSVPSREGDIQMSGTDDQPVSQEMPPPHHRSVMSGASNLSNVATTKPNTQVSQRSAFQAISHDTPLKDILNDASTTTSGKKTSDGWSTQATNGVSNQLSSSPVEKLGDSQLPDTQRDTQTTSGEEWPHSQAHALARGHNFSGQGPSQTPSSQSQPSQNTPAVPAFHAPPRMPTSHSRPSGFANLLNDSPVEPTSSQGSSQKDFIADESFIDDMLTRLVEGSSGCSIEQLEQINRELMETLWKERGEYNRNLVADKLVHVFNQTITDIEDMQKVLAASQP
jgi:hypothetical protein